MIKFLLLLLLASVTCLPALPYPALCTRVIDGDTIVVQPYIANEPLQLDLKTGQPMMHAYGPLLHIRLAAIDCPEHDQPYGLEAKRFTETCCLQHILDIRPVANDRYGRQIAWVLLILNECSRTDSQSFSESCLNTLLVRMGMAWHYKQYDHMHKYEYGLLERLEHDAYYNHRGLWQEENQAIAPWDWRRGRR